MINADISKKKGTTENSETKRVRRKNIIKQSLKKKTNRGERWFAANNKTNNLKNR